jgi:hypothetical protein
MKPDVLSPRLQEPATCPCPEPDQSSPCAPFHFFKIYFSMILASAPQSSKRFASIRFPLKHLYSPPYVLHAPPISVLPIVTTSNMNATEIV